MKVSSNIRLTKNTHLLSIIIMTGTNDQIQGKAYIKVDKAIARTGDKNNDKMLDILGGATLM